VSGGKVQEAGEQLIPLNVLEQFLTTPENFFAAQQQGMLLFKKN
jgi:hypothetical protein